LETKRPSVAASPGCFVVGKNACLYPASRRFTNYLIVNVTRDAPLANPMVSALASFPTSIGTRADLKRRRWTILFSPAKFLRVDDLHF
jgi:hypothetical protein